MDLLIEMGISMKHLEYRNLGLYKLKPLQKLLISLFFITSNSFAEQNFVDIGFTPKTSALTESFGFGVYGLKEDNSLYMNFNIGLKPSDYTDYVSSYGTVSDIKQVPFSFNVGKTFPILPDGAKVPIYKSIHSYFGVGYASLTGIAKYTSSGYDRGYYNYTSKDESGVNLNGGLIFMFNSFGLNVGVNSLTKSAYINIGAMVN
jgi:hypothetical protein